MTTNQELATRWSRALAPNYGTPSLFLESGRGARVRDVSGRRYLDFIAGLAVVSVGHAHPRVAAAIAEQASRLGHVSNLYGTEQVVTLAERLLQETGYAEEAGRVFFCNSGVEANEFAIKLARRHAHVKGLGEAGVILATENSFHGRTVATLALQGQPKYRKNFGPFPPGFAHTPYNDVDAMRAAFEGGDIAAMFVEPVQGEGGVIPATREFLRAARELTRAHDALLIIDEVQTGVARTGEFLAQTHAGVRADVTTLAKGLGGGFPIGAAMLSGKAAELIAPGDHGCTFGGNPLASATALAVLDVIRDEKLVARAAVAGTRLRNGLTEALGAKASTVRGLGLLDAVVLAAPDAKRVRDAAQEAGLLVNAANEYAVRLAPPLTVSDAEIDEAVAILAAL